MKRKDEKRITYQNIKPRLKSSIEARRLIRAALKRHVTERAASYALRLPNQAQLHKMLHGRMKDTPAMRAALKRAGKRAEHAYFMVQDDSDAIDRDCVNLLITQLECDLKTLKECLKRKDTP